MLGSLKTENLKRYKDVVWLLMKYGRGDLVRESGLNEALEDEIDGVVQGKAEELAADLEKMGPTFIKLGQLLSTRADLLPRPYMEALTRLQDKVEPFSFEEVEVIIATELGMRLSKAFADFDPVPLAAASLGQVHRATMRDGRLVVVKVQRPGIKNQILQDLEALHEIAVFLDKHTEAGKRYQLERILDEFRKTLIRELDYKQEGRNLQVLKQNLAEFESIVVPSFIPDYTTSVVLTMEYIAGKKITSLGPLARIELRGRDLAEQLFRAYLKQILVDGFFHADPHPGNVFLTDDGRIALLDLGMVAHINPRLQEILLQLLFAVSEGRSDEAGTLAMKIGDRREDFDETEFRRRLADIIAQNRHANLQDIEVGSVMLEIVRVSADAGIRVPPELTLLGKALLNLDLIGETLDPTFDPNAAIRKYSADLLRDRLVASISPGNLFSNVLEIKEFLGRLPERLNKILDAAAANQLQFKVDAIDQTALMEAFQKVANRITVGLVLAAMIIGAAMLMRVETSFRILGYPGIAILFFSIAAAIGMFLVIQILLHDKKSKQ